MGKEIDFSKIPVDKAEKIKKELMKRQLILKKEKELHEEFGLNYRYFRFWKNYRLVSISIGYVTLGSPRNEENNIIEYAVALQSKNDNFSRKDARRVINQRWKKNKTVKFYIDENIKAKDVVIACHYNSKAVSPIIYGLKSIPKYLRYIPIHI